MRTIVYIDGFNFYYGGVKDTKYKWLDFMQFFIQLLDPANYQITKIKYFTAKVSPRPSDQDVAIRQMTYIRALESFIPEFEAIYGHFLSNDLHMPLVHPSHGHKTAFVTKTEEKGSDVNIAIHALNDAWKDNCECSVFVTNDSDLAEALRIIKRERRKKVILIPPVNNHHRRPSNQLKQWSSKTIFFNEQHLADSQLPHNIPGTNIHKPDTW